MKDNLVRTNLVLTKKLRSVFQAEANRQCAGNMSLLFKLLLAKRYDLPKEIEPQFRYMLDEVGVGHEET